MRSFLVLCVPHWDHYRAGQAYSLMTLVDLVAVRDDDDNFMIKKDRSGKLDCEKLYSRKEFIKIIESPDFDI